MSTFNLCHRILLGVLESGPVSNKVEKQGISTLNYRRLVQRLYQATLLGPLKEEPG